MTNKSAPFPQITGKNGGVSSLFANATVVNVKMMMKLMKLISSVGYTFICILQKWYEYSALHDYNTAALLDDSFLNTFIPNFFRDAIISQSQSHI